LKICLVCAEHSPYGGIGAALRRQAEVLGSRHEVERIEAPEPSEELQRTSFAGPDHLRSAAVLEAIERVYPDRGPDLVEVCDYRALGLVALQARQAGHELLRQTTFAVRVSSPAEMIALHDHRSGEPWETRVGELEREQFRLSDLLFWPGGDVLELYRSYYRDVRLPVAVEVPRAFPAPSEPPPVSPRGAEEPLRILYAGRLQQIKGVLDLVDACLRLPRDDWELTLIGADTATAPFSRSIQMTIEAMCGGDPRVRIEAALPREELQVRFSQYHLLVMPSRLEFFGNVGVEAMRAGVPVLATPVGALTANVQPGVNGWLAEDVGAVGLGKALLRLIEDPGEVERVRLSGEVFASFRRLTDPEKVLAAYENLPAPRPAAPPTPPSGAEPLVTAVVPYYRAHRYIREAVESLLRQSHRNLEVLIVNDGSFAAEDAILDELAGDRRVKVVTQLNRGDLAARTLGIRLARGDYLLMFDADNTLDPTFVSRALTMLAADPELAYATSWLRFTDQEGEDLPDILGYAPLGNAVLEEDEENWDGDMAAVFPRRVLEQMDPPFAELAPMQGDWQLYRRLRERGSYGAVIPECLVRYRVHPESLLRSHDEELHRRSWEEGRDVRKLERTRWTAEVPG
jgi:glycosyltransferase involved in cell wall biosynthesis